MSTVCASCTPGVVLDLSDGQRVLEHIGSHILFDSGVDNANEPCGLCLRPSSLCRYFVVKGRGAKASLRIDTQRSSGCQRSVNYQYARAASSVKTAPCSNVPLVCPLCPKSDPAVWKYNLEHHLIHRHSVNASKQYMHLWEIKQDERDAMKFIWTNRKKTKLTRKSKKKQGSVRLQISDEHKSTAAQQERCVLQTT